MGNCSGLWRRSLLIDATGTGDTSAGVLWLQGDAAYVDSRGFAGHLERTGDVFHWHRDVDFEPPGPFPDTGRMHWEGDTLVETGVHEDYVEHWVRDDESTGPSGAVFLRAPDGGDGVLLQVGPWFGWVGAGAVHVGRVSDPQWNSLSITLSDNAVQAAGIRWDVVASEGMITS